MGTPNEELLERYKVAYGHVVNNSEEAIPMLRAILKDAEKLGDHYIYARAMNSLGVTYATIGNEVMALDCYLQGLDYAARYNVHGITHYFYNNIGSRYQELESYEKALDYFLMAEEDLESSLTLGEDNAINFLVTYLNLGDCYRYFKAFDRAEKYMDRTEKIMKTYKVQPYAFPITLFKATLYMDQGKDEQVRAMIGELIEEAKRGRENLIDYSRFVKLLAGILTRLRDMDSLR